jgi:predicted RNA methylase
MYSSNYTVEKYKREIDEKGLRTVWEDILGYALEHDTRGQLLDVANFGELYEIGLAHVDKSAKKKLGVYYTPKDVADVLSAYLKDLKGDVICDVCCGTGNLILSYLDSIGEYKAKEILGSGKVYLYEMDEIALEICKASIGIIYGREYMAKVRAYVGDFLDADVHLPENAKVISNPPYAGFKEVPETWCKTDVLKEAKELYAIIMEKILRESVSSVLITPFSFIGGNKFYSLRKELNKHNGFILAFDNVPANIFNGRKHGIFNTNTANAVRAAITVVENRKEVKGFRLTPLLRFSSGERTQVLDPELLKSYLDTEHQIVTDTNKRYYKCFKELKGLYKTWLNQSTQTLSEVLSDEDTKYTLYMPNTCRYFVTAVTKDLKRTGKIKLRFKDKESFEFAYCILNSSFAYLYWRMYEGAITYSDGLLKSLPIFKCKVTEQQKPTMSSLVSDMIQQEESYLVYKKNASEMQESVKFPVSHRDSLNALLIGILGTPFDVREFDRVHSNTLITNEACGEEGEDE